MRNAVGEGNTVLNVMHCKSYASLVLPEPLRVENIIFRLDFSETLCRNDRMSGAT